METFPTYGELLLQGFGEAPESSVLRTQMESGPAKQAQVRSKELVPRNVTYRYSSAEYTSWKAWRKNNIALGALWFDWQNPLTGTMVQARIVGGDYNAVVSDGGDGPLKWDVSFVLENYE